MLDLVIRGGHVVDGTGAEARRADVGVRSGRIVEVGRIEDTAARVLEAAGAVVAPGFIDPHTHYDAQLFWDPAATPSCYHGVTTVLAGNCGFSLAPLDERDADYLRRMMARVEGMPLGALEAGVPWDWSRFGDYLDRLEGRIAVNAGFLVGHSAIRRMVLGERAGDAEVSSGARDEMARVLAESLAAGGLGLSSSHNTAHSDGDGNPVPSRSSGRQELLELAGVVREHPGTTLEFITAGCMDRLSEDEMVLMADLSAAAQRPLNWNVLSFNPRHPEAAEHQLASAEVARRRGGRVVALTMPTGGALRLSFHSFSALNLLPGLGEVLDGPIEERLRVLADPTARSQLARRVREETTGALRGVARFESFRIGQTHAAANARHSGRTVGEIAAESGRDPFEVLCEIVVADGLRTHLWPEGAPEDATTWRQRAALLRDPRTLVGGSDAGAHLDRMCGARYPTELLAGGVRRFGALGLEEAVRMLTDEPARLFGLRDRGRVAPGWCADLVVLDPERVDARPIRAVADLPRGCERLTSDALGVAAVIVNGVEVVSGGSLTGDLPGVVLRSGRDTSTVRPG